VTNGPKREEGKFPTESGFFFWGSIVLNVGGVKKEVSDGRVGGGCVEGRGGTCW